MGNRKPLNGTEIVASDSFERIPTGHATTYQ